VSVEGGRIISAMESEEADDDAACSERVGRMRQEKTEDRPEKKTPTLSRRLASATSNFKKEILSGLDRARGCKSKEPRTGGGGEQDNGRHKRE
jgi:hypothetical protein